MNAWHPGLQAGMTPLHVEILGSLPVPMLEVVVGSWYCTQIRNDAMVHNIVQYCQYS